MTKSPIRVLIVDDSATIRGLLRATIRQDPRLAVAGEACDPYEAREKIKELRPDVLTLDVEMPRMNGLDFLERLMRLRPMPVVMVSTRTRDNSAAAIRALSLGAVDCVEVTHFQGRPDIRKRLADLLVAAGRARIHARAGPASMAAPLGVAGGDFRWNGNIVLIGSSTGGVDAIERVLASFPAQCPPTLIAQHMPASFLESFARRLDGILAARVRVAEDGTDLVPGLVLLAGGGADHLGLAAGTPPRAALWRTCADDVHVPSVDHLFTSAVPLARRIVAVVLTGMGRDGSAGLMALRHAGAQTIAQSAETCVIDGMPRAAREAGAVGESVPLDRIGDHILRLCSGGGVGG